MIVRASCHQRVGLPIACFALALALSGCDKPGSPAARPTSGEATADSGDRAIVALGRLEPAGGVLEISAIPGDVLKGFGPGVSEGAEVDAGAELARVESYDLRATQLEAVNAKLDLGKRQREQEIALAEANREQAVAAKAEVEAKLEEIDAQGDALETLAETARIAAADYESLVQLQASDPDLVSERQLRRRRNQADQAGREFDVRRRTHAAARKAALAAVVAATQNLQVAELNLALAKDIDRNAVTEIERKVAQETLEQSVLRAPTSGDDDVRKFTILKILMSPGEFVTQVPVMQIGDLSRMVCIAEVYEADVKDVVVGQQVTIRSAALGGRFADGNATDAGDGGLPGKVVRVGTVVSSAGLIQRNPLAPSDRSIVEVLIDIGGETPQGTARATREAARHIGMQVTVQFGKKPAKKAASPAPAPAAEAEKESSQGEE
jgi:HlyD family secretion protein